MNLSSSPSWLPRLQLSKQRCPRNISLGCMLHEWDASTKHEMVCCRGFLTCGTGNATTFQSVSAGGYPSSQCHFKERHDADHGMCDCGADGHAAGIHRNASVQPLAMLALRNCSRRQPQTTIADCVNLAPAGTGTSFLSAELSKLVQRVSGSEWQLNMSDGYAWSVHSANDSVSAARIPWYMSPQPSMRGRIRNSNS